MTVGTTKETNLLQSTNILKSSFHFELRASLSDLADLYHSVFFTLFLYVLNTFKRNYQYNLKELDQNTAIYNYYGYSIQLLTFSPSSLNSLYGFFIHISKLSMFFEKIMTTYSYLETYAS